MGTTRGSGGTTAAPGTPNMPHRPDSPGTPHRPDTPGTSHMPHTPDTPHTPHVDPLPYGALDARSFPRYAAALGARFPELDGILGRWGLPGFWCRRAGIESLFRIILEQQISFLAARSLARRVSGSLGGLTARRVYGAGPEGLRSLGLSRQKARYCHELARAVVERRLSIAGLARMSDGDAIETLCAQPGIGPWSAAIYLMSALKRIDVWAPGDLALKRGVEDLFPGDDVSSLAQTGDRWQPWRAVAARLVWHHYRCNLTNG